MSWGPADGGPRPGALPEPNGSVDRTLMGIVMPMANAAEVERHQQRDLSEARARRPLWSTGSRDHTTREGKGAVSAATIQLTESCGCSPRYWSAFVGPEPGVAGRTGPPRSVGRPGGALAVGAVRVNFTPP